MTLDELSILISANTKDAEDKINKLETRLERFSKKIDKNTPIKLNSRHAEKSLSVLSGKMAKLKKELLVAKMFGDFDNAMHKKVNNAKQSQAKPPKEPKAPKAPKAPPEPPQLSSYAQQVFQRAQQKAQQAPPPPPKSPEKEKEKKATTQSHTPKEVPPFRRMTEMEKTIEIEKRAGTMSGGALDRVAKAREAIEKEEQERLEKYYKENKIKPPKSKGRPKGSKNTDTSPEGPKPEVPKEEKPKKPRKKKGISNPNAKKEETPAAVSPQEKRTDAVVLAKEQAKATVQETQKQVLAPNVDKDKPIPNTPKNTTYQTEPMSSKTAKELLKEAEKAQEHMLRESTDATNTYAENVAKMAQEKAEQAKKDAEKVEQAKSKISYAERMRQEAEKRAKETAKDVDNKTLPRESEQKEKVAQVAKEELEKRKKLREENVEARIEAERKKTKRLEEEIKRRKENGGTPRATKTRKLSPEAEKRKALKEENKALFEAEDRERTKKLEEKIARMKKQYVDVDTSRATRKFSFFRKTVRDAEKDTQKTAQSIKKNKLDIDTTHATKKLKSLQKELKESSKIARSFGTNLNNSMKRIGFSLASLGIGTTIAQSTKHAMDAIEIDNLFYVSLGQYAKDANKWCQELNTTLGVNTFELKRNLGVLYAMSTSMGVTREAAYSMSKDLTMLTYDISSLYNLRFEDAFVKIKAGLVGETEPLRAIGILVDENTTKMYAQQSGLINLADGFSQTEKVIARYYAMMGQTGKAQGDFARTIGSPANQLRMLQVDLKMLGIALGQCFLPIAEIVLPLLRQLTHSLTNTLSVIGQFMSLLFGTGYEMSQGNAIGKIAGEVAAAGETIEKAGEKARKGIMSFDEINQLQESSSGGSGSGKMLGNEGINANFNDSFEPPLKELNPNIVKTVEQFKVLLDALKKTFLEIKDIFMQGFSIGFSDSGVFDSLIGTLAILREQLQTLFTDPMLLKSATNFATQLVTTLGTIVGSLGQRMAQYLKFLFDGFNLSLMENSTFFKEKLISIFDIGSTILENFSTIFVGIGDLLKQFISTTGTIIFSDFITALSVFALSVVEVCLKIGESVSNALADGINLTKDKFKLGIENLLLIFKPIMETLKLIVKDTFSYFIKAYDTYIGPAVESIIGGFFAIAEHALDMFNNHIAPVLQAFGEMIKSVYEDYGRPFIEALMGLIGRLAELLALFFNEIVVGHFKEITNAIIPTLTIVIGGLFEFIDVAIRAVLDLFRVLINALNGIIDFLVGVFTGDWERAWKGICGIVTALFDTVMLAVKTVINVLIAGINTIIGALNKIQIDVPEWIGGDTAGKKWGINIQKIPKLARGGIVDGPTLAMIGEAGKEMVVPLENTSFVNKLASSLGNAVLTAMSVNGTNSGGSTIIEIDGHELARAMIQPLQKETKRMGVHLT